MSPTLLPTLPDAARLWLLALTQPVDPAVLAPEIDSLLGKWRHKGTQYQADWALLEGRILAIAEPTLAEQPSGCAIDGMQRGLGQALGRLGLRLEDPQAVLVRLPEGLSILPRSDLAARLGLSHSLLSKVESDERTLSGGALAGLAAALGEPLAMVTLRAGIVPPELLARILADPDRYL